MPMRNSLSGIRRLGVGWQPGKNLVVCPTLGRGVINPACFVRPVILH